jgi:uncharacterized coiled-coil DUF342 family protein
MAQATQISPPGRASIAFELEGFAYAGDRLELSGRWLGVRGRRFVRPTITMRGPDGEIRALADLEHKPWAAEDGETWLAAFPSPAGADDVDEVELSVAPDITLTLPPPGGTAKPRRARSSLSRISSEGRRPSVKQPHADERDALRREIASLRATRDEQRHRISRLEEALSEARDAGVETTAAMARRDATVEKLDALLAEHETVLAARSELEAERDRLIAERSELDAKRGELIAERDALRQERDSAAAEHQALRDGWDAMVSERDAAIVERDAAIVERQGLLEEHESTAPIVAATEQQLEATRRQLDAVQAALEQSYRDRDAAIGEASAARRERDDILNSPANMPLPTPPVLVRSSFRRNRLGSGAAPAGDGAWLTRAIAIAVFVIVVLAVLIVLRGF